MCNLRSPRQDPRRAPAPHGEGLPRGAPRVARAGTASSPQSAPEGPAARPPPAHTSHRLSARRGGEDTCGAARPRVPRSPGPGHPQAGGTWAPLPPGPAHVRPGGGARPRPPPAPGPGPAGHPGLGPVAQPQPPPARPTPPSPGARVHPRARAWDSPGPGESCGAAAAALHGDSRSERGARRGGPAGPPQGRLRARGPGWRGRPACRGLEAAARRARRRHGRGASGGQPGAAGEELAVAGLGREVPATSWCSDLHTAPGGRGSDRLAPAQGLGLWCGRRASFEGRET